MTTTAPAPDAIRPRWRAGDYVRLVRIEHALFSLPVFVAGALVAGRDHFPGVRDWLLILVAGTAARSLALGLNRLIDRQVDALNPRTRARELPAGRLTTAQVVGFLFANLVAYLAAAWMIAPICLRLSWVPLALFVAYPYMKRFTALCHFGVGSALAMAPLGGYLAAAKAWPIASAAWMLAGFTLLWVSGFDIIYARLDVDSDREQGLFSLPGRLGDKALFVSAALHASAVAVLAAMWVFWYGQNGWLGWPIAVLGLLFWLEHRHARRVEFAAFRINTIVGFVLLAFVVIAVLAS